MTLYKFYTEELQRFKTSGSKKTFLTRARKQAEEHLKDLENTKTGFLHGERVTARAIRETKNEIQTIERIYKTL